MNYRNKATALEKEYPDSIFSKVIITKDNGEMAKLENAAEHIAEGVNPLTVFYITNRPDVALVAEKYGVDRIWIDLETLGKEQRQHNMNTVKSNHRISDIVAIKPLLTKAEMMVRINSWYEGSRQEIDAVIAAGADIIMLPYWKTVEEVQCFINAVQRRCKTTLLLETKEAVECIDEVLAMGGFEEIHIGLNDLHLSYGLTFMFIVNKMVFDKFYAQSAENGRKIVQIVQNNPVFSGQAAA